MLNLSRELTRSKLEVHSDGDIDFEALHKINLYAEVLGILFMPETISEGGGHKTRGMLWKDTNIYFHVLDGKNLEIHKLVKDGGGGEMNDLLSS